MVGPTLGQRRDDNADVGPALGRPSMLSGIFVSVLCFVLFCYQLVVCFFVASPVSDTTLSDNKWAKCSFAELLYVRTWQDTIPVQAITCTNVCIVLWHQMRSPGLNGLNWFCGYGNACLATCILPTPWFPWIILRNQIPRTNRHCQHINNVTPEARNPMHFKVCTARTFKLSNEKMARVE